MQLPSWQTREINLLETPVTAPLDAKLQRGVPAEATNQNPVVITGLTQELTQQNTTTDTKKEAPPPEEQPKSNEQPVIVPPDEAQNVGTMPATDTTPQNDVDTTAATSGSTDTEATPPSEEYYEIKKVLAAREKGGKTQYKIRWKDYSPKFDSWEPEEHLNQETLDFLKENPLPVNKASKK